MALDPHDELGIAWDDLADGRVHRLMQGRDFVRTGDVLDEAAENAARRLGRVVRTFTETRWGVTYFWFQFVDYEVAIGDPCPCGGTRLEQVNEYFAECASCKSTVALIKPRRARSDPDDLAEDEPLLMSLFANGASAGRKTGRRRADAAPVDPRSDPARLEAYSKIRLFPATAGAGRERLYGHGLASSGGTNLLVVDFALDNGRRVPETVWSLPAGPFGSLVRLDRLGGREPALELEQPEPGEAPRRPPPTRLSEFAEIDLALHRSGKKGGARFRGWGRLPDGETVLMLVQYAVRDTEEPPVPTVDETAPHSIRCVPLAPFGDVVDTKTLLGEADEGSEPERATMEGFRDLVLFAGGADERRERLYGRATGRGGQAQLVVVDYPLADGERIRDAAYPTGLRHTAWSLPGLPFGSLIDFDALDKREPVLAIEDPLAVGTPDEPDTDSDAAAPLPPASLSELEDLRLAAAGTGADRKRTRLLGVGRTQDGEELLLTVRYSGPERERKEDLRSVPLEPFRDVVDTEKLLADAEAGPPPELVTPPPPPVPAVEAPRIEEAPPEPEPELDTFAQLRLFYYGWEPEHETYYGHGRTGDGQACLLVVEYTPGDEPVEGRAPKKVLWVPTESFGTLIDLGPLNAREPAIALDGPGRPAAELPAPGRLDEFKDLHLFVSRRQTDGERHYGYGRTRTGETALLSVRDEAAPGLERPVCWVPLAPFISMVDLDLLFSATPHLLVDTSEAELAVERTA